VLEEEKSNRRSLNGVHAERRGKKRDSRTMERQEVDFGSSPEGKEASPPIARKGTVTSWEAVVSERKRTGRTLPIKKCRCVRS